MGTRSEHRMGGQVQEQGRGGGRELSWMGYTPPDVAFSEAHTCSDGCLHPSQGRMRPCSKGRLCHSWCQFPPQGLALPHLLQTSVFVSSAGAEPRMELCLCQGAQRYPKPHTQASWIPASPGTLTRGRGSKTCDGEKRSSTFFREFENNILRDPHAWILSHGETSFLCNRSKGQKTEHEEMLVQGLSVWGRGLRL